MSGSEDRRDSPPTAAAAPAAAAPPAVAAAAAAAQPTAAPPAATTPPSGTTTSGLTTGSKVTTDSATTGTTGVTLPSTVHGQDLDETVRPRSKKASRRTATSYASHRERDLARARAQAQLALKEHELALARIAVIELRSSSSEDNNDEDDIEDRQSRVATWVDEQAALTKAQAVTRTTQPSTHRVVEAQVAAVTMTAQPSTHRVVNEESRRTAQPSTHRVVNEESKQEEEPEIRGGARASKSCIAASSAPYVHPAPLPEKIYGAEGRGMAAPFNGPGTCPKEQKRAEEGPVQLIAELAAAINNAVRAAPSSGAPRHMQDLPVFNGASSDWLPFKAAYEESSVHLSETENLSRLRRSLKGVAKEVAHCLFVGATSTRDVMKLLASTFGRPDALVTAEMDKLRGLPRITDNPREVCMFACKVVNVTATIKALGKHHYLYNSEVVRAVVEKMPSTLRYMYYNFTAEQMQDEPDLIKLKNFLEQTAERCGGFAPAEKTLPEDRREHKPPPTKKPQRGNTYHLEPQKPPPTTCPVCKRDEHRPADCTQMKTADIPARWDLARKHRLCFRCLKTRRFRHVCKPRRCDIDGCTYMHHPLLHGGAPPPRATETAAHTCDTREAVIVTSTREEKVSTALLKILPVQVVGPKGVCDTYALLDDGSTCTLIESAVAEKIGANGPREPFYITGVAGAKIDADDSQRVLFTIRGRGSEDHTISARTMADLNLSPQSVPAEVVRGCPHLRDLEMQLVYEEGTPTILIGQDNWHLLISYDVRRGERGQPAASLTDLGWVLHGVREASGSRLHRVNHLHARIEEEESMEKMMKDHFSLEALGVEKRRSYTNDEQQALRILEETTRRLPAGGFETGLLWRPNTPPAPNNYDAAVKRLQGVERKLDRDEEMKKRYTDQMQTLLDKGYAEVAPTTRPAHTWYLPHFAVINPEKPGKLRIVHDAAARTKGTSLNDMLLSGPDLLQSLPGVLMRLRQRPIAVTADINDMFMRVTMREEDRDMQRFLWRGDRRDGAPTEYRMKSVIFGATSSPCTAIFVKNKNAEHYSEQYPEAAAAIVRNHYVDDYFASFDTEEEATRVSFQVALIHSRANFFLQRWASNSHEVRDKLAPYEDRKIVHLAPEKILGMVWDPERDTLSFNINRSKLPTDLLNGERTPTKREALRVAMSIYDPLGIATPVTIQAKRILQDTWRLGIEWDAELPHDEAESWRRWTTHVQRLSGLAVPRCYPALARAQMAELHTFVDASSSAYAATTYWRVVSEDGTIHVSLVAAKGRVAPLKTTSIPRLELQAAVLGCRLAHTAMEEHDIKPSRRVFWTDSRTVLAWLRTGPRVYKPFVAHRVAEIAEASKTAEWRWVPTKHNVADDATRDTPHDFDSTHRWFHGPDFLHTEEESWPQENEDSSAIQTATDEERITLATVAMATGTLATGRLTEALPDLSRFTNWMRVMRITARILQFIDKLRARSTCAANYKRTRKNEDDPAWQRKKKLTTVMKKEREIASRSRLIPIEARYLHRARQLWVRAQQAEVFGPELIALKKHKTLPTGSRLSQLAVLCDEEGILRLRSRVAAATDITAAQREPAIVDGEHTWTRMYVAWVHQQLHHGGIETTINEVRQHYWVLRLRHTVRREVKRCQTCRVMKATAAQPSTGNHPPSRLAHHQRAFTFTGLDYFGPMTVTVGRGTQKKYGVLFTCLTTRAVHLEIAGSLSTDSAVMALRRFIGRRGCPTELWSDQGTNLKGADLEMRRAAEEALQHESSVHFIRWRFIPPSAPFMGGAWERLVRSVKTALRVTLHERAPKEEVLATLLVEAENTINSRPLTYVSTAPDDPEALTPNHFLLGGPSRVPLPGAFTEEDAAGRKEWRASQRLANMFWSRWVREYLPELQHRREPRATKGAIKLGDLVLIADGTLPRNSWPRGVVVATFPGPDGEVRAVDVRTNKGVLRRPTKKLVILPTTTEPTT